MTGTFVMTDTIVETGLGKVLGRRSGDVHIFLGIPYAAPPFGADRLRPPRPATPWSGVRDALTFGAEPLQLRPPADHPAAAMIWDPASAFSWSGTNALALTFQ